ncbi:MAG: hypothetical protein ACKN93_03660, partial [Candidatus Limnocylindrus sp.]
VMRDRTSGGRRFAPNALLLLLFARAAAAFALWNILQCNLNVFATTLPGWLVAGVAGDLLAHDVFSFSFTLSPR